MLLRKILLPWTVSPFSLAGTSMKAKAENHHFLILGSTGSGKSTALYDLLRQIRKKGDRAVVLDMGCDYMSRFFEKGDDMILPGKDKRSSGWSFNAEDMCEDSAYDFAASLVAQESKNDPYWSHAAREILACTLKKCLTVDGIRNKDIADILMDIDTLRVFLKGTPAQQHLSKEIKKQSSSIMSMLSPAIKFFLDMSHQDTGFSIREWVGEKSNFLFLSSKTMAGENSKITIGALFASLSSRLIVTVTGKKKRTWIIIDEAASAAYLKNLPTLITVARKNKVCIALAIQDIALLEDSFGTKGAKTIQSNMVNKVVLNQSCGESAKKISNIIGSIRKKSVQKSTQLGVSDTRSGMTDSESIVEDAKIAGCDIQNLKSRQAFLLLYEFPYLVKVKFKKMSIKYKNNAYIEEEKIDKTDRGAMLTSIKNSTQKTANKKSEQEEKSKMELDVEKNIKKSKERQITKEYKRDP